MALVTRPTLLLQPASNVAKIQLVDLAHARSGDKGDTANVGVIAYRPEDYDLLRAALTTAVASDPAGRSGLRLLVPRDSPQSRRASTHANWPEGYTSGPSGRFGFLDPSSLR